MREEVGHRDAPAYKINVVEKKRISKIRKWKGEQKLIMLQELLLHTWPLFGDATEVCKRVPLNYKWFRGA